MQGIIQPEQQLVKNALKDITKILQDQIVAKFVLHQNGLMQEQQAATTVLRDINAPETVQKFNAQQERMQGRVLHLVKNVRKENIKMLQVNHHASIALRANGPTQEQQAATTVLRDINAPETVQKLNAMPERMQGQDQVLAQIVHQANGQAVAPAPVQKNVQPDIYARETVHYHNALQELMPLQAPAPAINAMQDIIVEQEHRHVLNVQKIHIHLVQEQLTAVVAIAANIVPSKNIAAKIPKITSPIL